MQSGNGTFGVDGGFRNGNGRTAAVAAPPVPGSQGERPLWESIHIPAFPQVALRVLDCVSHDGYSMCRLSDLISSDPALCSEVLTMANSPLIPHRFPVTSIMQAVARLGTYTLRGLCLTVAVRGYLGKAMNYPAFLGAWRHSLATALIARRLVEVGAIDLDDAHTAGILHEIGRLGLAVLYPANYARLLDTHAGTPESMMEEERELFGFDHVEIGHHLVEDWALPADFHAVIGHSGAKPTPGKPGKALDLDAVIHLSCRMADLAGFPAFAGCSVASFEELQAPLTWQQQARFYPDQEALASDISNRIAGYEAL